MQEPENSLIIIDLANFKKSDSYLAKLKMEYDLQLETFNNLKNSSVQDNKHLMNQLQIVNETGRQLNNAISVTKEATF